MPLSLTRLRGVAARRQLQELGGDAALANQFTPPSRQVLAPGSMQRAGFMAQTQHPRLAFREQADLEAQREAQIRGWAELALRQKDSDFARDLERRRMGLAERRDVREGEMFGLEIERGKLGLGEERVEAGRRGERFGQEKELYGQQKELYGREKERAAWQFAQDKSWDEFRRKEAEEAAKHLAAGRPMDIEARRLELEERKRQATTQPERDAIVLEMKGLERDVAKQAAEQLGTTKDAESQLAPIMQMAGQDQLYRTDPKTGAQTRTATADAYLQVLAKLRRENPDMPPEQMQLQAARKAGVRSERQVMQDRIRALQDQQIAEKGYSGPSRRLRRESDEYKQAASEIAKLQKMLEGSSPSPLDSNVTRSGVDIGKAVEDMDTAFSQGTPQQQARAIGLLKTLIQDEGEEMDDAQKAELYRSLPYEVRRKMGKAQTPEEMAKKLPKALKLALKNAEAPQGVRGGLSFLERMRGERKGTSPLSWWREGGLPPFPRRDERRRFRDPLMESLGLPWVE